VIRPRIRSLGDLRDELKAVARGDRPAPAGAAALSFNSIHAVLHLLTPENRMLLATIREQRPASVAELVRATGRDAAAVAQTLEALAAAGFVKLDRIEGRTVPVALAGRLRVEIDP
jgi:predicted transcriptional regulator